MHVNCNNTINEKPYIRTLPSTIRKLEADVATNTAGVLYKKEISSNVQPELIPVKLPQNIKQLRNLRYKSLHRSRISHDSLYNIHELAYDINGFIWKITTYPDLICIFGMKELLDELDKVLILDSEHQLLSYDTTFELGDFYLSPLIFRHTLFLQQPWIPAIFLLHERKLTSAHMELFRELGVQVPELHKATCTCPIVTDREVAITNAITSMLPNLSLIFCWNHYFVTFGFGYGSCGILTTTSVNSLIFMSCIIIYTNDFVILVQI